MTTDFSHATTCTLTSAMAQEQYSEILELRQTHGGVVSWSYW